MINYEFTNIKSKESRKSKESLEVKKFGRVTFRQRQEKKFLKKM